MTTSKTSTTELFKEGQPLVYSLAAKIFHSVGAGAEMEDLVGYGELGLAEAARDFDPERGCRFTTFAYYRIRGAIYDGLSQMSWMSRAQYHRVKRHQMANEALAEAADQAGAEGRATLEANANWFSETTGKLAVIYFAARGESGGGIRDSAVEDPGMSDAPNIVALKEISQKLHELVRALPDAESQLITSMYFEGSTLQDAAKQLGISKSWASRLHAKTLDKLASSMRQLWADD